MRSDRELLGQARPSSGCTGSDLGEFRRTKRGTNLAADCKSGLYPFKHRYPWVPNAAIAPRRSKRGGATVSEELSGVPRASEGRLDSEIGLSVPRLALLVDDAAPVLVH